MKKRLLATILALVMVLALLPGEALAAFERKTVKSFEELKALVNDYNRSGKSDQLEVNYSPDTSGAEFVFSENITIPKQIALCVDYNTVRIPAGITVNAAGALIRTKDLVIEANGKLEAEMVSCHGSATVAGELIANYSFSCDSNLIISGSVSVYQLMFMDNALDSALTLTGDGALNLITPESHKYETYCGWMYQIRNSEEFQKAIQGILANGSREHHVYSISNVIIAGEDPHPFEITADTVIPEHTSVTIHGAGSEGTLMGSLTIAAGSKLTNNGETLTISGSPVTINGALENNTTIQMYNFNSMSGSSHQAVMALAAGGSYSGSGTIIVPTQELEEIRSYLPGFDLEQFTVEKATIRDEQVSKLRLKDPGTEPALPTEEDIPAVAHASAQTVTVDGKPVEFQMYALKDASGNDTNYIKLRDMAYVLKGTKAEFSLGYDQQSGTITATTGGTYEEDGSEMKATFGGADKEYVKTTLTIQLDGKPVQLEAITLTDDAGGGYNYCKVRDLGQTFNFNVDWNTDVGIYIESDKPYSG